MKEKNIENKVKKLLFSNLTKGKSKLLNSNFSFIKPSPKTYPYQFFWDTCFHVFILCQLKRYETAKQTLNSLFKMQEENGFVGHMIFWESLLPRERRDILQAKPTFNQLRPHMSALIQPPLISQSALRVYEDTKDKEFIKKMYIKLNKYFNWLKNNRDFDNDGLIELITTFESGMDWSPTYDEVVSYNPSKSLFNLYWKVVLVDFKNFISRYNYKKIYKKGYFIVKDVLYNSIYAMDLYALSEIALILNKKEESKKYKNSADKVSKQIVKQNYSKEDKAFFNIDQNGNKSKVFTPSIFYPLCLPNTSKKVCKEVLNTHLLNKEKFNTPYPLPSVAVDEKGFTLKETKYLWRGPTWSVHNWFIYKGLKRKGLKKEADILKTSLQNLIEKSGFREYYHPYTGKGMGAKNFTWSGLILDMK